MKRLFAWMTLVMLLVSTACARDEVTRDVNKLPAQAREFVSKQFPKTTVAYLKIDRNMFRTTGYDVKLDNGTELEFDRNGDWTEISSKSGVPSTLIPATIADYVKRNYANHRVVKIKRKSHGYKIELGNDLELKFDSYGKFVRLDD